MIEGKTHIASATQLLIYRGNILDENYYLLDYNITKDDIIFLNPHIRGRETKRGTPSSSKPSFKDILHKKLGTHPIGSLVAQAYIVERYEKYPQLELTYPLINGRHDAYTTQGIICKFNGSWP